MEVDAAEGKLPRNNSSLIFVLRMMQLAVEGRQMLRDCSYKYESLLLPYHTAGRVALGLRALNTATFDLLWSCLCRFPDADESVLQDVLPLLGALHLESQISGAPQSWRLH